MKNKSGFTLVEILVVVLIIGILTVIAVPMYQSAVDKTHWSTLLPTARALKNAEEAYLMSTNAYTDNADALDVAATEGDATYELQMPDPAARYVIRATSDKLPNVRLAQYLDENASYGNLLFCEAATDNERANKLCEKTLNGQKVYTTDDSYTAYLMDTPCRKGTNYLDSDKCGFENKNSQTIGQGEVCIGTTFKGCQGSKIQAGGECLASSGTHGCAGSEVQAGGICSAQVLYGCWHAQIYSGGVCEGAVNDGCNSATIYEGGICHGTGGNGCYYTTIKDGGTCQADSKGTCQMKEIQAGGRCIANAPRTCTSKGGEYVGGCCTGVDNGKYCPSYAPRCTD